MKKLINFLNRKNADYKIILMGSFIYRVALLNDTKTNFQLLQDLQKKGYYIPTFLENNVYLSKSEYMENKYFYSNVHMLSDLFFSNKRAGLKDPENVENIHKYALENDMINEYDYIYQ